MRECGGGAQPLAPGERGGGASTGARGGGRGGSSARRVSPGLAPLVHPPPPPARLRLVAVTLVCSGRRRSRAPGYLYVEFHSSIWLLKMHS
jgi:hypothetical protein